MKTIILALAATAALSSPVLAAGDTTSRLDAPSLVLNADGMTASTAPMMDERAALNVSDDDASRRGPDVNNRPYDQYGNFRF